MTTLSQCITIKAGEGKIDKKKAEAIAEQYDAAVENIMDSGRVSRAEAEEQAITQLQIQAERDIARKKRMALTHAKVMNDIRVSATDAEAAGVGVDIAMSQRLAPDPRERVFGVSLEERIKTVRGEAQARMVDFLEKFRTKTVGLTQLKTGLDDIMREMFGENSGSASAKNMAGALQEAVEHLRLRFNAAGGDIVERTDWGFFQVHDKAKVAAANKQDWVNFVIEELDMAKMVDANGFPMSRKSVHGSLQEVYDSIATGGLSDLNAPSARNLFGSAINKRANSRFLHFKNADSWLKYQKQFGNNNIFDHIVGSITTLSREVALLETLGPHPEAAIQFMERMIDEAAARGAVSKTGRTAAKLAEGLGQHRRPLTALYNTVSGRIAIPENGIVASVSQANRNIVIAATLGSSWFAAIADIGTQAITAKMNGLSATRVLGRHMKMFAAGSAADRKLAVQLNFGAQGMASRALGAQRIMGEVTGPELTERIADTALRAGFLSPWTEAGRWGFQIEMLTHITNQSKKSFDQLDNATRGSFERHGITPEDWDLIRTTDKWVDPESRAEFIRAEDVARGEFNTPAFEAGNKLQQAIFTETEFAIISSSPRVRAALTGGAPAGTFWGEVMRNTALFKGFPLSIMYQHWGRTMAQRGAMGKIQYAGMLFLAMTSLGAVSEQLTQIARGKDPLDMTNLSFYPKAAMRGGAWGLVGDIVFQDQNRFGGGLWEGLLGPVAGQVEDLSKLTVGNVQELLAGDDTNIGREISRFVESNTPGRTLWYSRLATERIIFDELDRLLDPKAHAAFRSTEQRAQTDYRQKFFSRPGSFGIQRGPDIGAAFGQ
jgi:hypothetical protein